MDIHCQHKLHGRVLDNGLLEVSCQSRWCGKTAGTVVLHRFDLTSGEVIETLRFKKPPTPKQDEQEE